jgi:DNA primase
MNTIDEIKARLDIVDLVSESVQLRHAGKNYTGFCPFHANSRTPAFVVFPDTGTWRCFGQCNEGGDIFRYVMKKEGLDFPEALQRLADRAGVVLQPQTPQYQAEQEEHERLHQLLEETATFYRHQLVQTPAGKPALEYLQKRGLKDETIERFGLGYAPSSFEATSAYLYRKGYSEEDLLQAGLLSQRDGGGAYDRFRNRVTFPIRDVTGKLTGFGARILDPNDIPKFLNSPQTILFDKGRTLYGLDQARKAIRAQDQVVIVEGYLDVIALHQEGFQNSVSPMGTALTEAQLHLLKRFTRRIVLALDPDAAGEKATLRGLEITRQAMDHATELTFDARGLLRHEARLQADVRVTTLPDGQDPDDVVLQDPANWSRIVEGAKPVVIHVMDTLAAGQNLEDPKVKSQVAAQVIPLIEDVANPVERDAYRQRLARLLKVDERSLTGAGPQSRMGRGRPNQRQRATPPDQPKPSGAIEAAFLASPTFLLENFCLSFLVKKPELIHLLDRKLQEGGLGRLDSTDFSHTEHQMIFKLVQESVEQTEAEPGDYVLSHVDEALRDRATEWLAKPQPSSAGPDEVLVELVQKTLMLRLINVREHLNQIRFLQEEIQQDGDLRARPYNDAVLQYSQLRDRLDRAINQITNRR